MTSWFGFGVDRALAGCQMRALRRGQAELPGEAERWEKVEAWVEAHTSWMRSARAAVRPSASAPLETP